MRKTVALLGMVFASAFALATDYPESGDKVVIGDMTYVLVRAGDWHCMTAGVAKCLLAYDKMNGTEEGRVAIHGRRGHTTITNGTITVEYADGYKRTEDVVPDKKVRRPRAKYVPPRPVPQAKSAGVVRPSRLASILELRKRAQTTTNEVTVTVEGGK